MTTYLLNTTIVPACGLWDVRSLPNQWSVLDRLGFSRNCPAGNYVSAVGHASTAEAIEAALTSPAFGRPKVEVNRLTVQPVLGDSLVCFKLRSRLPEGVVLDLAQLEAIGFDWVEMRLAHQSLDDFGQQRFNAGYTSGVDAERRRQQTAELGFFQPRRTRDEGLEPRSFMGGHRD